MIDGGKFILGPEVAAFEREFAGYCGARHAVGVANGTDALTIALRALGVGPGDEVVVPSFTFYASAEAIPPTGARPVFCDVDPETFCVTPETVRAALTPRTKAVIAVHLFGNVAPVAEIAALGVPVIEDAAQAAGLDDARRPARRARHAGHVQLLPVQEPRLLRRRRRDHHERRRARRPRADAPLPRLVGQGHLRARGLQLAPRRAAGRDPARPAARTSTAGRTAAAPPAEHYAAAGLGDVVALPRPVDGAAPAWHLYVVRSERADALAEALAAAGHGQKAYYRVPVHAQPAMRAVRARRARCPAPTRRRARTSRSR